MTVRRRYQYKAYPFARADRGYVVGDGMLSMSDRTRDENGRFVETITPERVLAVIRDADMPVLTAGDIAEELGCSPEAVTNKLRRLQDQNRVAPRQVGARAVVW